MGILDLTIENAGGGVVALVIVWLAYKLFTFYRRRLK